MNVTAAPVYFTSGDESLFAWVHQPVGARRSDLAVVICKPFGYEAICAHASLRAFADAAAQAGATALRFDYSGTGDSTGSDTAIDQMAQWCRDIIAAVDIVRRVYGARRVCLLGIRLGALLASMAAAEIDVDALVAIAPVVNGRRYLRELRAFQAAANTDPASTAAAGALEVTGFSLSAASVAALNRMDLLKLTRPPAARVLILDRDDLPAAASWEDALRATGAEPHYACLPGFSEMVSTPHAAQIPTLMISAAVEWLGGAQNGCNSGSPTLQASMSFETLDGIRLIETAGYIDTQRTLFGIVTAAVGAQAPGSATQRHGILLLNGGATSHVGPNRMYVELARRWAARGYVVLRWDLAGLGDSGTRSGERSNEVYPPAALDDIAAAAAYLRREHGAQDLTLAGLCAGAYHALRSAICGLPVHTLLLVNPLTFYWKAGSTLDDLQVAEVVRNPGVYAERVLQPRSWFKLLRGRVNLWRVGSVYSRRAWLALDSTLRDLGRCLNIRLPNDLGWDLRAVADRGVRIVFLFARGDAGAELLKVQGGSALKTIADRCRVHMFDGADHIFSQSAARSELLQMLGSELPH
ncbi:MAG: hypothetical protein NVSMB10_14510 [Steroidobacteraceae bacterium]